MRKFIKIFLVILMMCLIFSMNIMFIIGNYMYEYTISTSVDKTEIFLNENGQENKKYLTEQEIYSNWILDNSNEVDIESKDGIK